MNAMLKMTAVACILAVSGAAVALAPDDGVAREGAGARRAALDATELKPFPAAAWADLAGWTGGEALTASGAEGKVVVIVTWKSWYKPSHEALRTAQEVQDAHGKDGVIVVAVHDKDGFENAAKVMSDKGVSVLCAHDAKGAFREALNVDQDPDFYIVDRAGNLRFADIQTSAVEAAVRTVAGETAEQAAAIPTDLAAKAAAADAASRRSTAVADSQKPGQILNVPFTMPDAEAYTRVHWPEHNKELHAGDFQGKTLPASLGDEVWLSEKPNTTGRIVVLDFWATWCGPCKKAMPGLDALQRANRQDLVIIGMSGSPAGSYKEDPDSVKAFLRSHKSAYYHANDLKQTINNALQVRGIPHVVVMSTDGVVRWQGMPGDPGFRKAVETLIRQDPGVKARRAAEAAHKG